LLWQRKWKISAEKCVLKNKTDKLEVFEIGQYTTAEKQQKLSLKNSFYNNV